MRGERFWEEGIVVVRVVPGGRGGADGREVMVTY